MNANINVKSMTERSFRAPRSLDQNVFDHIRFFLTNLLIQIKTHRKLTKTCKSAILLNEECPQLQQKARSSTGLKKPLLKI